MLANLAALQNKCFTNLLQVIMMRSRCSVISVNFVITVVALPPCLPGVEMMEESEEQSDVNQSDLDLRKGNSEGESFRWDSATRPPS